MLLPLFPPASRYHVPGNVPHTPPLRPPRAVANLWDAVTNQSTPGQAKHTRTLLWHMRAGSPDITATCHILTSPNTQLRQPGLPGSQCSPWEFKPSNKALGGFKPCSCWGHRNIQDLLHRGEATLVLRHSQGCLYLQGRVQPSITPVLPNSLLTSLVDVLFKPTQISRDFIIQPGDKRGLAGYIQKG